MDIRLKPFGHQGEHARALQAGLKRHGVGRNPKFVACWGWRTGAEFRKRGHEVLVFERGYLGDRFSQTSIGWNGLNGRAQFPEYPDDGGARFRRLNVPLANWREGGDYALIVGQVPGDAALQGKNLQTWYVAQAARGWGQEVRFRPHPLAHKRGPVKPVPGTVMDKGDLSRSLDRAAVVVTYNSNTGVDAMLAGRPVTCEDEGSMIWGVYPENREAWAHRLAWKQWTLGEIESGAALEGVVGRIRER
jgi:hypothetical protein